MRAARRLRSIWETHLCSTNTGYRTILPRQEKPRGGLSSIYRCPQQEQSLVEARCEGELRLLRWLLRVNPRWETSVKKRRLEPRVTMLVYSLWVECS